MDEETSASAQNDASASVVGLSIEGILGQAPEKMEASDISNDVLKSLGIETFDDQEVTEKAQAPVKAGKKVMSDDVSVEALLKDLKGDVEESEEATESIEDSESEAEIEYDGEKFKVPSKLKEAFLRQSDYTKKTQAVAKERAEIETLKTTAKREYDEHRKAIEAERLAHREDLELKQKFDFGFDLLKEEKPELYEEVQAAMKGYNRMHSNPMIEQLQRQINDLMANTKQSEVKTIESQYRDEWSKLNGTVSQIEKLGIKIDESKVIAAWKDGAKDVKAALYAAYGDKIHALQASKVKLSQAQKTAPSKKVANIANEIIKPKQSGRSYKGDADITARLLGRFG